MLERLDKIKSLQDFKALKPEELPGLAKDIRKFLVQSVSKTGGHLASNLGVVELTMALHYVFNSPADKMIWDVGHQAYVHKILTGRRAGFKNLRKFGGMSGFPKKIESEHDVFETGHSSTSISAALGMAVARDLKGEDSHVIAVIGDGALTGGMAYEALNNAGRGHTNLIVILNDNEMSISENVGGMCKYLNRLRSKKEYLQAKEDVESALYKVPMVGDKLVKTVRRTKEGVKGFFMPNTLFEEIGLTYLGPIDGHSFEELIDILENAKEMRGPVLIHVKTKKGKGYRLAEDNPSSYHGVGPFNITEGVGSSNKVNFSSAFGESMCKVANEDDKVVAITAAMPEGTGLLEFSKQHPTKFFDVGIAEQHGVTFAAGLATGGYKPVVAVYSSFLQRAYDQILHDVCLQQLPVVFGVDRAGLVGEDGKTHQGIFDIAYLSSMPNMVILSPKMPEEVDSALRYALNYGGPIAIRYPRGTTNIDARYQINYQENCFYCLEEGEKAALIATGKSVEKALQVAEALKIQGLDLAVIEAPFTYPINQDSLEEIIKKYEYIFTVEDHTLEGGFGEKVVYTIEALGYVRPGYVFAYRTGMIEHGDIESLLETEHMSKQAMMQKIIDVIKKESI